MTYLKAFMAGITFPTILLAIVSCILISDGKSELFNIRLLHWIPIIWGIWNILFFAIFKTTSDRNNSTKIFVWGALLGLLVALYAIYVVHLPGIVGLKDGYVYLPLLVAPIVYGLLWVLVVKPLNRVVDLI